MVPLVSPNAAHFLNRKREPSYYISYTFSPLCVCFLFSTYSNHYEDLYPVAMCPIDSNKLDIEILDSV